MDNRNFNRARFDAWHAICELIDSCFVSTGTQDVISRQQHARATAEALLAQHGTAGETALLFCFTDICGALTQLAARSAKRPPEVVLNLLRLLPRELDFEPRNDV
ncbi:hypothetical protein [Lentzea cavernae]|uniref:Uncharacterized protein n=1 Tax=Lentzea cavernae TaxID=2020703 RepID=A0ABQ3MSV9_9PSEU|nr:hypothetical protein [Lentzea cavernae]GHH61117.1 hypothetical protein GCM10017774_86570 [Lentzea cavernae]